MTDIMELFYQNRNDELAGPMKAYMKNQFEYLGIKKPRRAELEKAFMKSLKKTDPIDWGFVKQLWDKPEREFQYLAINYLMTLKADLKPKDMVEIQELIIQKSWWDTVDAIASNIVGYMLKTYPELIGQYVNKWSEGENLWLIRTAILFQLKYKDTTDTKLLSKVILENKDTKEFFLNKAIGWILREYSKTDKEFVADFMEKTELSNLSRREGSKYI
ncbi:MAG: DNA alkylation repair protein [Eubacteriaceae bacterium]|nr:DNA alkylation repair protein [Eubacteriaceae bacterium]